jgi:hypothetical protein
VSKVTVQEDSELQHKFALHQGMVGKSTNACKVRASIFQGGSHHGYENQNQR